jgi:hypothetical protein
MMDFGVFRGHGNQGRQTTIPVSLMGLLLDPEEGR